MTRPAAEPPEEHESLWTLIAAPSLWAIHFLLSYATAAVWCAKYAGPDRALGGVRLAIAVYTAAALAGIGITAWRGFQRHSLAGSTLPHDFDSAGDRHRFLGFATLLLSGLSAVATGYVALTAVFIGTCH
jgi:hypothetical protein